MGFDSEDCKNSSVTRTPNLLHRHTKMEIGVSIEQIWCAGHTNVFTVKPYRGRLIFCVR